MNSWCTLPFYSHFFPLYVKCRIIGYLWVKESDLTILAHIHSYIQRSKSLVLFLLIAWLNTIQLSGIFCNQEAALAIVLVLSLTKYCSDPVSFLFIFHINIFLMFWRNLIHWDTNRSPMWTESHVHHGTMLSKLMLM